MKEKTYWRLVSRGLSGLTLKSLEEKYQIFLDYARTEIRVLPCNATDLEGKVDYPPVVSWILLEQVNFNNLDHPVIYSKDYHRGDYIVFNVSRFRY